MKIKSFECPKSIRNYEKNTWNVSRLVNKLFVPSARQTSVLCCRLLDLWSFGIRHLDGNCPPIFEIFTTFTQPAQSSVELSDQVPFLFTIHFELIQFDNMPNFQPIKTEMPEVGGQSGQLPTHIWSAKPVLSNYLLFLLSPPPPGE